MKQSQPLHIEAQNIFVYVDQHGAPIVQPSCNQGQCSQLQQILERQT
uniref:Pyrophosphate--fructose 6-phosphate 1-phosphotransferase n=1 Tax=Arundo donax TaxID=35708 RepID=A0A0A9FYR8_ARUDO